jgi:hypothetical protein
VSRERAATRKRSRGAGEPVARSEVSLGERFHAIGRAGIGTRRRLQAGSDPGVSERMRRRHAGWRRGSRRPKRPPECPSAPRCGDRPAHRRRLHNWRLAGPATAESARPAFASAQAPDVSPSPPATAAPSHEKQSRSRFACSWLLSTGPAVSLAPRTLLLLGTGVLAPRRLPVHETRAASGGAHEAAAGKADGK